MTDLVGCIDESTAGRSTRITFDLEVHRKSVRWMAVLNLVCAVVGPWSTELFFEMYSWYWQPPLCILAAAWVWWHWPNKALSDAWSLAPKWISEIRSRLQDEAALTAAVT